MAGDLQSSRLHRTFSNLLDGSPKTTVAFTAGIGAERRRGSVILLGLCHSHCRRRRSALASLRFEAIFPCSYRNKIPHLLPNSPSRPSNPPLSLQNSILPKSMHRRPEQISYRAGRAGWTSPELPPLSTIPPSPTKPPQTHPRRLAPGR